MLIEKSGGFRDKRQSDEEDGCGDECDAEGGTPAGVGLVVADAEYDA